MPGQLPGFGYGGIRLDKLCLEADGVPLARQFGVADPCPGEPQALMVRYEIVPPHDEHAGRKGERRALLDEQGCLVETFLIAVPEERPLVRVLKATYGHPLGSRRGRGAFEVTEMLQVHVPPQTALPSPALWLPVVPREPVASQPSSIPTAGEDRRDEWAVPGDGPQVTCRVGERQGIPHFRTCLAPLTRRPTVRT